ncbi:MAG: SMC-Scp complex subunit ScpB [Patescibacteria group bacterium]
MEQDNTKLTIDAQIEGILFWKGEPVRIKKLCQILDASESDVVSSLEILKQKLEARGLILVFKDDEVMLGTALPISSVIENLTKEELVKDLGKAGLETLSIILYKGPISRAEIDYIRGVQSNFIIRNLLVRGLIEKITKPDDQRIFLYRVTFEMLSYLGLSKIEDAPEYEKVKKEFEIISEPVNVEAGKVEESTEDALDDEVESVENEINEHRNESTDTAE